MTEPTPDRPAFSRDPQASTKTYTLVELVKGAPPHMIDHGPDDTVFAFPVVALLELLLALGVMALLLTLSMLVNAPLGDIANPNQTTDPAKAPWYFVGLQELLQHGHPTLMSVTIPVLAILFVLAIPYLDNDPAGAGRWFTSVRGRRITLYTALYGLLALPFLIGVNSAFALDGVLPGVLPQVVAPALTLAVIVGLPLFVLHRFQPSAREVVLLLFTLLLVAAVMFTTIGFLFRGPGFEFYWPWAMPHGYNPLSNL